MKQIRTPPAGHRVQCLETVLVFNSAVRGSVSIKGPFFFICPAQAQHLGAWMLDGSMFVSTALVI